MDYKKRLYDITSLCGEFTGDASHILGCALLHYNRTRGKTYDGKIYHKDMIEHEFYVKIITKNINLVRTLLELKQFYIDKYNAKF